ncbi:hypothetical protein TH25_18110 [Thalassospira profundimaris]|uniref:Uncharacterized protein n=1 Tax=Thalassospira profundimaris TaxID=502049 RepID=A0A367WXV7_9PROT|nr:hypothetical protein TH25_18110 [Thalassospira profundimaris]
MCRGVNLQAGLSSVLEVAWIFATNLNIIIYQFVMLVVPVLCGDCTPSSRYFDRIYRNKPEDRTLP